MTQGVFESDDPVNIMIIVSSVVAGLDSFNMVIVGCM